MQISKEAAEVAVKAKGSYGYGLGEEWMVWLVVVWILRHYAEALEANGEPRPNGVHRRKDGQYVVDTFALGWVALTTRTAELGEPFCSQLSSGAMEVANILEVGVFSTPLERGALKKSTQ